jgi:hypothetical protein
VKPGVGWIDFNTVEYERDLYECRRYGAEGTAACWPRSSPSSDSATGCVAGGMIEQHYGRFLEAETSAQLVMLNAAGATRG